MNLEAEVMLGAEPAPTPPPERVEALEAELWAAVQEGLAPNFTRWLRFAGVAPGEWFELQALRVPTRYGERMRFAHACDAAGAVALLAEAESWRAQGLYVIANRINPALATRKSPEQWHDAMKDGSTKDADIVGRRVVFLDVDALRVTGTSATEEEVAQTIPVAVALYLFLAELLGGAGALGYGHSGNGRQVFVAVEEETSSEELTAFFCALLVAFAARFTPDGGDLGAKVDAGVGDPKRLVPAFGTTKRKGAPGFAERPHRPTGFYCSDEVTRVPIARLRELLAAMEREISPAIAPSAAAPADARTRAPRATTSSPKTIFAAANAVDMTRVAEALGLVVGPNSFNCPGCGNPDARLIGNGLKCHHTRCADKGAPRRPGFRTPIDAVREIQGDGVTPADAARWILEKLDPATLTEVDAARRVKRERERASTRPARAFVGDEAIAEPVGHGARAFRLTDLGNAERLFALHGRDVRYCHEWGKWLLWDDRRWACDQLGGVHRKAQDTVRSIRAEARREPDEKIREDIEEHADVSESSRALSAIVQIARSLHDIPVLAGALDRDPWLFNCQNGTLDLKLGKLRAHDRSDKLTKLAPVAFDAVAECPRWTAFLHEIMGESEELVAFLQRAVGYALTGNVSEQCLFFLHGRTGDNGKSTFTRLVLELTGDYGMQASPDLLIAKNNETHPTEIADLFGRRLVVTQEIEQGKSLAEATVKQLTGGDTVKARRMREDFWSFEPTHKIFMAANHQPIVKGTDHAIWRRIRLVPFDVQIPDERKDPGLVDKLRAELPGILRWAVDGCLAWQRMGKLQPPAKVVEATAQYREEQDTFAPFLDERCDLGPSHSVSSADLFRAYSVWCEANGGRGRVLSQRGFSSQLRARQLTPSKAPRGGQRFWQGIRLRLPEGATGCPVATSRDDDFFHTEDL